LTLDEMLLLLPDNTTGLISAGDMRAIVTDLYQAANSVSNAYTFKWSNAGTAPAAGHVTMDVPWLTSATKVLVSETADDGTVLSFATLDSAVAARVWITTASGQKLTANITGVSIDVGTYRELPIQVVSIAGAQPANNAAVTVSLIAVMP
jgi:hypothetical protein